MNEQINEFKVYRNTYCLLKAIPDRSKQGELALDILDYAFKDIEPLYLEDDELYGYWINIIEVLKKTKSSIFKGKQGGRPKKDDEFYEGKKANSKAELKANQKAETKAGTKPNNNISYFLFLISNFNNLNNDETIKNKIIDWLEYKQERKEPYTERGLKSLLVRIDRATSLYGVERVIDLIDECMGSMYKGIIFEKLEKKELNSSKQSKREENKAALNELKEKYMRTQNDLHRNN